mmetsp:Transcript_11250/g.35839  ORF Transcript_11250/g.35839 Transcript_11250/m.35839 type:complete len:332 (+) Transcript_11250:81-1076(+)
MSGKEKAAICGGRPDARLLPRSRWAQYNTTARARACSPKPDRRARACLARGVSSSPSPTKHRLTPRLASTEARPPGRYDVAPKRWSVTAAASRAQPCRAMAPRVCRQKWRHRVAVITSAWPAIAMGQTTRKIRRTARAAAGSCAAPLRLLKAATLLPFSAAGMLQLAPIRVARERAAIAQKKERTYLTSRGATPSANTAAPESTMAQGTTPTSSNLSAVASSSTSRSKECGSSVGSPHSTRYMRAFIASGSGRIATAPAFTPAKCSLHTSGGASSARGTLAKLPRPGARRGAKSNATTPATSGPQKKWRCVGSGIGQSSLSHSADGSGCSR